MDSTNTNGIIVVLLVLVLIMGGVGSVFYLQSQQEGKEEQKALDEKRTKAQEDLIHKREEARLSTCLRKAEKDYQAYVKLNANSVQKVRNRTIVNAPEHVWSSARDIKNDDEDDCYRRY